MLYFCAGNIYKKWLNVNLKHRPYYVWFQNNPGQVIIRACISYSLYSNGQLTPVRIYVNSTRINFALSISFWISPTVKFRHVLGSGFMIQMVILILIKYFLANQNKL